MAKNSREFQHESLQDRRSVVKYLEALAEGIRNGTINLSNQGGDISLTPEGLMNFEIRASHRRDRATFSIRCTWKQDVPENNGTGPLTIDSNGDTSGDGAVGDGAPTSN